MRLEEEQAKLDSLKCDRLLLFESARADMEQLCEMLSEPLERRYEVGHEDLTERRLATFAARIAQLRELEEKRAAHAQRQRLTRQEARLWSEFPRVVIVRTTEWSLETEWSRDGVGPKLGELPNAFAVRSEWLSQTPIPSFPQ